MPIAALVDQLRLGGPQALAATKQLLRKVPTMSRTEAFGWTADLVAALQFAGGAGRHDRLPVTHAAALGAGAARRVALRRSSRTTPPGHISVFSLGSEAERGCGPARRQVAAGYRAETS